MKKTAFTMAEVMISLTIIGLLAVITLPNRILGTRSKAYNTVFKSAYSQLEQGITNNTNVKKQPFVYVGGTKDKTTDSSSNAKYTLDNYMKNNFDAKTVAVWSPVADKYVTYTSTVSGVTTNDFKTIQKVYKLKNGAALLFPNASIEIMDATGCTQTNPCPVYLDVNGSADPNTIVQCEGSTTTSTDLTVDCTIDVNSAYDMFPIFIKNERIYPATNATDFILSK